MVSALAVCLSDRRNRLQELLHRLRDGAPAEEEPRARGPRRVVHRREGPASNGQPPLRGRLPGLLLRPQNTGGPRPGSEL